MKRHHLTTLTAIAIVLAGALVVVLRLRAPEEEAQTKESLALLHKRQNDRFRQSSEARRVVRETMSDETRLIRLKARLLNEFPELRPKPTLPNEENPIYQLNQLANDLLDDSQSLWTDLQSVMGQGVEWDTEAVQKVVTRYASTLDQLDKISEMSRGSYRFEGQAEAMKHPEAVMLFLDLIRLRTSALIRNGSGQDVGNSLSSGARLERLIRYSEGTPVMHILMTEVYGGMPLMKEAEMNEEIYERFSGVGLYGAGMSGMMLPDWGAEMSRARESGDPDFLINQDRDLWDNQLSLARLEHDPLWGEATVARAYSAELNAIITELRTNSVQEFLEHKIPKVSTTGLTPEEHELVLQQVVETHETLREITKYAALQNLTAAARALRKFEHRGGSLHEADMANLPMDPVTGRPFLFDPESRIIRSHGNLEDGIITAFRLHPLGEGSLLDVGAPALEDE